MVLDSCAIPLRVNLYLFVMHELTIQNLIKIIIIIRRRIIKNCANGEDESNKHPTLFQSKVELLVPLELQSHLVLGHFSNKLTDVTSHNFSFSLSQVSCPASLLQSLFVFF